MTEDYEVNWGQAVQHVVGRRRAEIDRELEEYRILYPEWDDAIAALIHERKVFEEQAEEVARLKAKVKRLKRALKGALK